MLLHIRIHPLRNAADLDPKLVEKKLNRIKGIELKRVIDDRATGKMTLTAIVRVTELNNAVLYILKKALLELPKVTVNLMDNSTNETALTSLDAEGIRRFSID